MRTGIFALTLAFLVIPFQTTAFAGTDDDADDLVKVENPDALEGIYALNANNVPGSKECNPDEKPRSVFTGTASFYDPDSSDISAGTRVLADKGCYWTPDCRSCAVRVSRWSELQGHRIRACYTPKDKKAKCIECEVHDNGPGVRGVDLAPQCFVKLAPKSAGRIPVKLYDYGKGDGSGCNRVKPANVKTQKSKNKRKRKKK